MARNGSANRRHGRRELLPLAVLACGVAIFFLSIRLLGNFTRDSLRASDRYTIAFSSIECSPSPAERRAELLTEVQYLGKVPDRISVLDETLPARLTAAFSRHPWVQKVERVTVLPPRRVQVQLVFRTPVLRIEPGPPKTPPLAGALKNESAWLVDDRAVVLPPKDFDAALPVLLVQTGPTAPAGRAWRDPSIQLAARTAGYLRSQVSTLAITKIEVLGEELILSNSAGTRILWGHAPGFEQVGESLAAEKVANLLKYCSDHADLDHPAGRYEHDVRSANRPIHRPIAF
jgi:hypothetical protein